jgi:hypothetical protein
MSVEDRVKALNELFPRMDIWAAHQQSSVAGGAFLELGMRPDLLLD